MNAEDFKRRLRAAFAFALAMKTVTSRQRQPQKPLWKRLALIPAGLAVGLLVGWLGVLTWDAVRPRPQQITVADHVTLQMMLDWDNSPRGLYLFDEQIGYRFKPNFSGLRHQTEDSPHHTNALGLLGEREIDSDPSACNVLVLGDSATYGDGIPFEGIFVSRMQELAGSDVQLANGACPGWNLRQQLSFYQGFVSDVDWSAVVLAVSLNDFVEFMWAVSGRGGFDWMMTETSSTFEELRLTYHRRQFRQEAATEPLALHDDATMFAWQPSLVSTCLQDTLLPFLETAGRPPVILVLLPTRHQIDALNMGAADETVLRPQRVVDGFCTTHGLPCLEVVTLLRDLELPAASSVFLEGDALHFNDGGHFLLAEVLWPSLEAELAALNDSGDVSE